MMQVRVFTIRGDMNRAEDVINQELAHLENQGAFHVTPPVLTPWIEGKGSHARPVLNVYISYQVNHDDWRKMQAQETATPVADGPCVMRHERGWFVIEKPDGGLWDRYRLGDSANEALDALRRCQYHHDRNATPVAEVPGVEATMWPQGDFQTDGGNVT